MKSRFSFMPMLICAFSLLLVFESFAQQNLPGIRVSPQAKVAQSVGFAEVEINYSRPGMKGREIWGQLVPYGLAPNPFGNGKPMPWRAGANENTTISISHDAKINGHPLPAGTYGLHMLVHEEERTIIFSKDHDAWGSFFYEEENDALRVKVKPLEGPDQERLSYGFDNLSAESCDAFLHWGKVKVPFTIEFDRHKIVLDTYRDLLTSAIGFNQAAWGRAAGYCAQNNTNLDEAMTWIDKALSMNGGNNFNNTAVKARLLTIKGQTEEADKLMEAAIETSTEAELNAYGYQLVGQNRLDDAIKIFKLNIKRHPEAWNTYDSMGDALANNGDKKSARKNYEKALDLAPAGQKARIEGILKGL